MSKMSDYVILELLSDPQQPLMGEVNNDLNVALESTTTQQSTTTVKYVHHDNERKSTMTEWSTTTSELNVANCNKK